ncbi:MAG: Fe-S cluster assembly protein NifU [Kiritimatiellia bacterium]|nr:Fe-S cluster assembly protein NifU [Kiritimatiellia bacterium]
MWNYTDKVMDHFRNPRNVGKLEHPDGVGTVGSLACGDALTFMFKLGPDKRICEAKFQTFGCASAIASSSALTEMVIGKTLDEAAQITNRQIADYLGGLPDQKMHCSVMGREALEAAIDNYRTGKTGKVEIDENIVCTCFGVSENEILRIVRENNLSTVDDVANFSKAGGGCGQCRGKIQQLVDQVIAERRTSAPAVPEPTARKLTNLQRIRLVEEVIERDIRPVLKRDGGDVELVDVDGDTVTIAFRGHCAGCRSAAATKDQFIAAALQSAVDPAIRVITQA